jgi:hypothetical protein
MKSYRLFLLPVLLVAVLVVSTGSLLIDTSAAGAGAALTGDDPLDMFGKVATASVTPMEGTVFVRKADEDAFVEIDGPFALVEGDVVRTGPDGIALMLFESNDEVTNRTETVVYENTQIGIAAYRRDESDTAFIHLQQFIGYSYHRTNFSQVGSKYVVETPNGVASVKGTAFYVDVHFAELASLTPEELADLLDSADYFAVSYESAMQFLEDVGKAISAFDVVTGLVDVTYHGPLGVITQVLQPNQIITIRWTLIPNRAYISDLLDLFSKLGLYEFSKSQLLLPYLGPTSSVTLARFDRQFANARTLLSANPAYFVVVTIGQSTRGCGDGICDGYVGEDPDTCPEDCDGYGRELIFCGNGTCEPLFGEDERFCAADCSTQ